MVPSSSAGPHPSLDDRQAAERSRAGGDGHLHALPLSVAACGTRLPPTRRIRFAGGGQAAGRIRSSLVQLGLAVVARENGQVRAGIAGSTVLERRGELGTDRKSTRL